MKKSKILLIATLVATVLSSTTVFAGENLGQVVNGRTMIPLRGAFTDLGFEVSWDGATNTATLKDENHVIKVKKDDVNFTVDGVTYTSDVAPMLIDGSIYIPLRAIGDKIGAEVNYDKDFSMASMIYDEEYTYIFLGTLPTLTKSNYVNEADMVGDILEWEKSIIDEINKAIDYGVEGDFDAAYTLFQEVGNECYNFNIDNFHKLSPTIQENVTYFANFAAYNTSSYITAIEAMNNDETVFNEALDYSDKYSVLVNLLHSDLFDFYFSAY